MFCKNCGNQIEDSAKFCSKCGVAIPKIGNAKFSSHSNTPILIARPVYIASATIASVIPITIFMTIWSGGFFGGFGMFAVKILGLGVPVWFPFLFFAALAFFGIPFLTCYAKKKNYASTDYKFYPDRLEYADGFWTVQKKTIKYKNIIETDLRKGILQKQYGLGTIMLSTQATGFQQGVSRSGIKLYDIPNVDAIYPKVQQLIG